MCWGLRDWRPAVALAGRDAWPTRTSSVCVAVGFELEARFWSGGHARAELFGIIEDVLGDAGLSDVLFAVDPAVEIIF